MKHDIGFYKIENIFLGISMMAVESVARPGAWGAEEKTRTEVSRCLWREAKIIFSEKERLAENDHIIY